MLDPSIQAAANALAYVLLKAAEDLMTQEASGEADTAFDVAPSSAPRAETAGDSADAETLH